MKRAKDSFDLCMQSMNEPTTKWEAENDTIDEDEQYIKETFKREYVDYCPDCGQYVSTINHFPYCLNCNWDSLEDPLWNARAISIDPPINDEVDNEEDHAFIEDEDDMQ